MSPDFSTIWPFDQLRLLTPRLELHPIRDEDIPGLVTASLEGIHDPAEMPFAIPWTRQEPMELARGTAQHVWLARANLRPQAWNVSFVIIENDTVVGRQDVVANQFRDRRTVETGSWLTHSRQGRGLGKEMRVAVLLWAFDWLGAEYAETAAMAGNPASQGVSEGLGYRRNGITRHRVAEGEVYDSLLYRLAAADLKRPDWQLEVHGHEQVAALLGA